MKRESIDRRLKKKKVINPLKKRKSRVLMNVVQLKFPWWDKYKQNQKRTKNEAI
jgi:hypothetical protein